MMKDVVSFKLSTPIQHGDKEIVELSIRQPTTAEIRKVGGFPYKTDFSTEDQPELDAARAAQYLAICASIPPSVVDKMDIGDFQAACYVIYGFFVGSLSRRLSNVVSM